MASIAAAAVLPVPQTLQPQYHCQQSPETKRAAQPIPMFPFDYHKLLVSARCRLIEFESTAASGGHPKRLP